ncbi:uncharacterized protein [Battus philenor]|uniref:uncharacterized protein n=1 Tax=Battus philenor TaxID=42288 RepID=UPI0035D11CAA
MNSSGQMTQISSVQDKQTITTTAADLTTTTTNSAHGSALSTTRLDPWHATRYFACWLCSTDPVHDWTSKNRIHGAASSSGESVTEKFKHNGRLHRVHTILIIQVQTNFSLPPKEMMVSGARVSGGKAGSAGATAQTVPVQAQRVQVSQPMLGTQQLTHTQTSWHRSSAHYR